MGLAVGEVVGDAVGDAVGLAVGLAPLVVTATALVVGVGSTTVIVLVSPTTSDPFPALLNDRIA